MTTVSTEYWRRCSSCKNPIAYKSAHYVCSVSTCNRKRIGYVFCSVHCWERHLPGARHRDAAAIEATAPTFEQWKKEMESEGGAEPSLNASHSAPHSQGGSTSVAANSNHSVSKSTTNAIPSSTDGPRRMVVREAPPAPKEVLVVASKLKAYIRARSEMNTSDAVMDVLSDKLRELCDEAIENARKAGRKTVMDRDF